MRAEIRRVILGQETVIDQVLAALLAGGHVLLEGKPGLGKTHLVTTLARTFGGSSGRIQFTPDLRCHGLSLVRHEKPDVPTPPRPGFHQPAAGG
jgi:ABC-type transport system involved in cytochrome c biogenesis ATPase subunit